MSMLEGLAALCKESLRDENQQPQLQQPPAVVAEEPEEARPTKVAKTADRQQAATRHQQTEQRRRDRINSGFAALKELMPSCEKADKAAFLMSAVGYIRQLQGVLQQLLDVGALAKLPEDTQWSVRMLLPRKDEAAPNKAPMPAAVPPIAATHVANGGAGEPNAAALLSLLTQPAGPAQPAQGLDAGQLLAFMQQMGLDPGEVQALLQQSAAQQQAAQSTQLLAALQMQALLQASTKKPVADTAAASILPPTSSGPYPNLGLFLPAAISTVPATVPLAFPPAMSAGCGGGPAVAEGVPAMVKAKKNDKVRRHTTRARRTAAEGVPGGEGGRPGPAEVEAM